MNYLIKIAFGLASWIIVTACSRENERPANSANTAASPTAETTQNGVTERRAEASTPAGASARNAIAESRCEREQRCENIGENKKFSSVDDCVARVSAEWKDDLSARECPAGIDQNELSECLNEIRTEDCNNPIDKLSRVAACTSNQICRG